MQPDGRTISDQCDTLDRRIVALPERERAAIAVGAAWRLMSQYLRLPEQRLMDFTVTWANTVSTLWESLPGPTEKVNQLVEAKLREYYSGPYCHELGDNALPGADEDTASAAIYATEAYCTGNSKAATCAAMQLLTDAESRANSIALANGEHWNARESDARTFRFQQIELNRLGSAVSLLEMEGLTDTMPRFREIFADDAAGMDGIRPAST